MKNIRVPYEDLKKVNECYFNDFEIVSKKCINSGWYILGENVIEFENKFAYSNNSPYCVGVANGLDALILGLLAFDFKIGSKVLVPSNTYIASILAIFKAGLQPVLVEPDPYTFNITIENIQEKYTDDCVAILPVHLYGRICPMEEIISFAKNKNLKVIEDCAQSHFAKIGDKFAGTFGDIGAFSFYPTKNLGSLGDAGAILCKEKSIYDKLKAIRNYGSNQKYYNSYLGLNSRLDEIQAAFLNIKLPNWEKVISHKRKLADVYFKNLVDLKEIQLPINSYEKNVWHIFNIITSKRDDLKSFLFEFGISTEIHYPIPPHKQIGYSEFFKDQEFPISEKIHKGTLSLPISTCHNQEDIEYVCKIIKSFFNQ